MRPTQTLSRRIRRLTLTTKQTNKGFYKGTGSGATGTHTKHGGYVIDWAKVRTYVCPPGIKDFVLTPFVTKKMEPTRGDYKTSPNRTPRDGQAYLDAWKIEASKLGVR